MTMFASAEIKFYPRIYSRIPGFQLTGLAGLSCTVTDKNDPARFPLGKQDQPDACIQPPYAS